MQSLIVLMAQDAPSFCYYPSPAAGGAEMSPDMFERVADWARRDGLMLHLVCGSRGLPEFAQKHLADERRYACYLPAEAPASTPNDIPVVRADGPKDIDLIPANRHTIGILRVPPTSLNALPEVWETLASKVYRVVTVLLDLDRYEADQLERYDRILAQMRNRLGSWYQAGRELEVSCLSDRMALQAPCHCQAGLDHLTIDPAGGLHICPGFAATGADPVGRLGSPVAIPNAYLLRLEHAPICAVCDAFHCRRCVYVNLRSTLEINTPPWQACRASHREREQARLLLSEMQSQGVLMDLQPIPGISYEDPLELLLNPQRPRLYEAPYYPEDTGPEPPPPLSRSRIREPAVPGRSPDDIPSEKENHQNPARRPEYRPDAPPLKEPFEMASNAVGRVSPQERDTIKNLHLRKAGLAELFTTLTKLDAASLESNPLYDKLINDMGAVSVAFQAWWDQTAEQYGWPNEPGKKWRIDFDTCEIFLE